MAKHKRLPRLTAKQQETVKRIHEEYSDELACVILLYVTDPDKRSKILHECFVHWAFHIKELRSDDEHKEFLLRKALHYCKKCVAEQEAEENDEGDEDDEGDHPLRPFRSTEVGQSVEDAYITIETYKKMKEEIKNDPNEMRRAVLMLIFIAGESPRSVSRITGIDRKDVYRLKARGIRYLRKRLGKYLGIPKK